MAPTVSDERAAPAKARTVKAYAVTDPDEHLGGIVFAKTAAEARRAGAKQFSDGDPSTVEARRTPWADEFATTGIVPAKVMIANGWWFEDYWTGAKIDEDYLEEKGLTIDDIVGHQRGPIFACQAHADAYAEREGRRAIAKATTLTDLKALLAAELPGAVVSEVPRSQHWYGQDEDGRFLTVEARIEFTFSGMTIGPAQLRVDHEAMRPYVTCCSGDKEAFRAFLTNEPPLTNIWSVVNVA